MNLKFSLMMRVQLEAPTLLAGSQTWTGGMLARRNSGADRCPERHPEAV
tara:strand:- start:34756 stop:34902 length:147 start_codon:yes stop_codon:yes gene_type:complete